MTDSLDEQGGSVLRHPITCIRYGQGTSRPIFYYLVPTLLVLQSSYTSPSVIRSYILSFLTPIV